jgi:hypothetical protein
VELKLTAVKLEVLAAIGVNKTIGAWVKVTPVKVTVTTPELQSPLAILPVAIL